MWLDADTKSQYVTLLQIGIQSLLSLAMTGDLIPKKKKAKKFKATGKLIEPECIEDQPILKTDGGKSDELVPITLLCW